VKRAALALGVLGIAQMLGDVTGMRALAGVAGATAASPAPRVLSSTRGLETFSSGFALEIRFADGRSERTELTPELNARLRGPCNRRNVYGAILAYGPVLASDPRTQALFQQINRNALCGAAPLLRELGLAHAAIASVAIEVSPRAGAPLPDLPLHWTVECP
jgi:hypothetical protein